MAGIGVFFGTDLGLALAIVVVEVEVAQGQVGLAVLEESGLRRAGQGGGQGAGEHGEGQGGLVHCVILHVQGLRNGGRCCPVWARGAGRQRQDE
ncbi:hypothetical protein D3C78_1139850 [compost metagenome]